MWRSVVIYCIPMVSPYRIFNIIRDISESYRKQYETQRLAERLQLSESEAKLRVF